MWGLCCILLTFMSPFGLVAAHLPLKFKVVHSFGYRRMWQIISWGSPLWTTQLPGKSQVDRVHDSRGMVERQLWMERSLVGLAANVWCFSTCVLLLQVYLFLSLCAFSNQAFLAMVWEFNMAGKAWETRLNTHRQWSVNPMEWRLQVQDGHISAEFCFLLSFWRCSGKAQNKLMQTQSSSNISFDSWIFLHTFT